MRTPILLATLAASLLAAAPAQAASPPYRPPVSVVMQLEAPLESGEYAWDESGAPPGRLHTVVDIDAQQLYVYRGGVEIGRASIIYGADEKPTPLGEFPILEKDADHYSNLYEGAPMPWMLRLTWDGVAIHGAEVDARYATHGCIGVPDDFAALLFARARKGDIVTVTNRWMRNVYGG